MLGILYTRINFNLQKFCSNEIKNNLKGNIMLFVYSMYICTVSLNKIWSKFCLFQTLTTLLLLFLSTMLF